MEKNDSSVVSAIVSTGDSDAQSISQVNWRSTHEVDHWCASGARHRLRWKTWFNVVQPSKMLADPLEPATSSDQMLSAEAPCPVARGWITYTPAIHQWCTVTSRVFGCPVPQFRRRVGCSKTRKLRALFGTPNRCVFFLHRSLAISGT